MWQSISWSVLVLESKLSQLAKFSNSFASRFRVNTLLSRFPSSSSSLTCGAAGCAACGSSRWELSVTIFSLLFPLSSGVVELNVERNADLHMVDVPVTTLGDSDASACRVVFVCSVSCVWCYWRVDCCSSCSFYDGFCFCLFWDLLRFCLQVHKYSLFLRQCVV